MMRLSAYAINEAGGSAVPFEYDAVLGPYDVLVRFTHRTTARGDVQAIDDEWGDTRFPLVPSHEMLGVGGLGTRCGTRERHVVGAPQTAMPR
jgi:D-arabinose 1-dehydrogenase-like Zn-dependent alcohol dehydrogenase